MKIMCLNGWGGLLHQQVIDYLADANPDVLCLQEAVATPGVTSEWLRFDDGNEQFEQRANFYTEVSEVLAEHAAILCPSDVEHLWEVETKVVAHYGLATFVRQTYPIIGQASEFVHNVFTPFKFGGFMQPRNAHGLRVYDIEQERTISITHMHGLRDSRGKVNTPERVQQVQRLLEVAQTVRKPGDIEVICGDFNVVRDSETISYLRDNGYVELVTEYEFPGTRTSHYKKEERFADYMFVNDLNAVKAFEVVYDPEVSDHCPLVLEV